MFEIFYAGKTPYIYPLYTFTTYGLGFKSNKNARYRL